MAGEDLFHRFRHFADGCFGACRFDAKIEKVGVALGAFG